MHSLWNGVRRRPALQGLPGLPRAGASDKPEGRRDGDRIRRTFDPNTLSDRPTSMWRYWEFLPAEREDAVSLGEGLTPLTHLPRLGKRLGLSKLYVKNETMNPTWSFKDRLASSAVSFAPRL